MPPATLIDTEVESGVASSRLFGRRGRGWTEVFGSLAHPRKASVKK